MTFMTTRLLSKQDEKELRQTFISLDKDGNGILSREELITGYSSIYPLKNGAEIIELVDSLLKKVDINEEGVIKFTDFMVAAADKSHLLSKKQIMKVFRLFDKDGSGFIEWNELKDVMGRGNLTDQDFRGMIGQFDKNSDGKVSPPPNILLLFLVILIFQICYAEFEAMILHLGDQKKL